MVHHNIPKVVQLVNLTSEFDLLASAIPSSLLLQVLQNTDCNPVEPLAIREFMNADSLLAKQNIEADQNFTGS